MINKIVQSVAEAMAGIKDGATVLIGGFGAVGQPNALIDGLIEQGATDLTVAANNAGVGRIGLARLMDLGLTGKVMPYKRGFGPFPAEIYHAEFPSPYRGVTTEQALADLMSRIRRRGP